MNALSKPVFFQLLVDRQFVPGAVLLDFDERSVNALDFLSTQPEFLALVAGFPCLIRAGQAANLSADLLASFQAAGCLSIENTFFYQSDERHRPALPAAALWLKGNWFLAPPPRPSQAQSASRTLALKLLQLVNVDADARDIEAVLRQDPTLSYHLLRLVNSLGMGSTRHISSFSHAILILGRNQLRRWLNLMLFTSRNDDYRAPMLLAHVMVRARCMELLAKEAGLDQTDQDTAFMVGMFSMLGILFGTPLEELIQPLQLSEVMVGAVCDHQGDIGQLLLLLEHTAQHDTTRVIDLLTGLHLTTAQFMTVQLSAMQWMLDIAREVHG